MIYIDRLPDTFSCDTSFDKLSVVVFNIPINYIKYVLRQDPQKYALHALIRNLLIYTSKNTFFRHLLSGKSE